MDPALLHPQSASAMPAQTQTQGPTSSSEDRKPALPEADPDGGEHYSDLDENDHDHDGEDGLDGDQFGDSGEGTAKRPRLRLAHACDRCRKRKIRCDTQQPCGPCQATKNECTFHTPSRRTTIKPPKAAGSGEGSGSGSAPARSASTSNAAGSGGVKRPHSPPRDQKALEARLAALESMLRDVPPNVHNAFLSSLDARLGGGVGVGLKEGRGGDGVGVAPEALTASGSGNGTGTYPLTPSASTSALQAWVASATTNGALNARGLAGLNANAMGRMGMGSGSETLAPSWGNFAAAGGLQAFSRRQQEEEGVDVVAKKMEGMSFFYEDEIGQAKWQGATSGFPLLSLLTAANVSEQETSPDASTLSTSPLAETSPLDSTTARRSSSQQPRHSISGPGTTGRSASTSRLKSAQNSSDPGSSTSASAPAPKSRFFPDRTPRPHQTLNPEASWKVITSVIPPDLMDTLVRCYLSTSHLLWPFLHVPSFLADYANPNQWGEPGFACFIVAVCTLSSRHVDDPRVRANATDPSTAGKTYFELFKRLRDLPAADRPTLYSTQAAFLAAIYAFGLGNLSKAFALQAESITLCLDGGLHRSVDGYDHFDAIEKETRKVRGPRVLIHQRTFWAIYSWDKQSAALFGRPPIIHLRDCDVTEPLIVDDDYLTPEGVKEQPNETKSRLNAFVAAIRLHVILEGVIDSATQPSSFPTSPFLARAAATIARRSTQHDLKEEEDLLDEWERILPKYWQYDQDTTGSRDPIRITQAERLHCLQHLVKMIIYRHRFSGFVVQPASTADDRARHLEMSRKAMQCALTIIADHVHISQRGMMTYYGVHVIHQLAQAGRTLVAVILNCRNADFRPLISPAIEGLRSCVGLLRRFSGRYLCGLRSADIIDEFCRICNIPVDSPRVPDGSNRPSPAWLRPVHKRRTPSPSASRANSSSPAALTAGYTGGEDIMSAGQNQILPSGTLPPFAATPSNNNVSHRPGHRSSLNLGGSTDLDALFNTEKYFGAMSPPGNGNDNDFGASQLGTSSGDFSLAGLNGSMGMNGLDQSGSLGNGTRDSFSGGGGMNLNLPLNDAAYNDFSINIQGNGLSPLSGNSGNMNQSYHNGMNIGVGHPGMNNGMNDAGGSNGRNDFMLPDPPMLGSGLTFDFGGSNGFGGEMLAGEGMDSVSDGLKSGENQGLSAATILSLLEEGSFDYGAMFTDQAPLPMDFTDAGGL